MSYILLGTPTWVTTRKAHCCLGCNRDWPVGSSMYTWSGKDKQELSVERCYLCIVCKEFSDRYFDADDLLPDGPWSLDTFEGKLYFDIEAQYIFDVLTAGVTPAKVLFYN